MIKLWVLIGSVLFSSMSFAAKKDLQIFNTLRKTGVSTEKIRQQFHIGVNNVECSFSRLNKVYECTLFDVSADGARGFSLPVIGNKAKNLYKLLIGIGAPTESGLGRVKVKTDAIHCSQAESNDETFVKTISQRTSCLVNVGLKYAK